MELLTSIEDIKQFDERFREITRGLPISTGSLLLLSSDVWHRWGIGITEENIGELRALAEEARLIEISKREGFPILEQLARPKMREWLEPRMARHMGDLVKAVASDMAQAKDVIFICDLPCRDGITSGQIIMGADKEITEKMRFNLVDSSMASLEAAMENVKKKRDEENTGGPTGRGHHQIDHVFLDGQPDKCFDIIVSLSHFHHKSFLLEFLKKVSRVLRDDGILIVGDRHSSMLDHPHHTYHLLASIGAERQTLKAFKNVFGESVELGEGCEIDPEELEAISHHRDYWIQIANDVRRANLGSSVPRASFLEANDTSKARRKKLEHEDVGFTTDPGAIRKAFPSLSRYMLPKRMTRGKEHQSDFAVVMAAVKRGPAR